MTKQANKKLANLAGLGAGAAAALPVSLCGGACGSCFACLGVGGVLLATVAAARVVTKFRKRKTSRVEAHISPDIQHDTR